MAVMANSYASLPSVIDAPFRIEVTRRIILRRVDGDKQTSVRIRPERGMSLFSVIRYSAATYIKRSGSGCRADRSRSPMETVSINGHRVELRDEGVFEGKSWTGKDRRVCGPRV